MIKDNNVILNENCRLSSVIYALKMETARFFETMASTSQPTRCLKPKEHQNRHLLGKLKAQSSNIAFVLRLMLAVVLEEIHVTI
jgi:hypothetical protein